MAGGGVGTANGHARLAGVGDGDRISRHRQAVGCIAHSYGIAAGGAYGDARSGLSAGPLKRSELQRCEQGYGVGTAQRGVAEHLNHGFGRRSVRSDHDNIRSSAGTAAGVGYSDGIIS
jgi:hypothetical protein